MKPWFIAANSIRRLLRERSNIFFVFILPMLLILVLGASFSGAGDKRVGLVSEGAGELGEDLAARIDEVAGLDVVDFDQSDDVILAVERGRLEAAVIIPPDYDQRLREGEEVAIEFVSRPEQSAQAVRNTIESVATEQGSLLRAAGFAEREGAISFEQALANAEQIAQTSAGVEVSQEVVGEPFALDRLGQFDLGAYSELILFVFLTSMTGSTALIESRHLGVSRRMLSTPTSVRSILAGESLGRFGVALVQGVFIMVGSALAFGVEWGDPVGAIAILVVFSFGAAATGMLMGATFKNEQQAGGIGVVLGLGLAALGGAMVPLSIMKIFSPTLWQVAHITPHAWGIEAYEELILHGGNITDIGLELTVLGAFAVVVFALGAWRLRISLTRP